jgi:hypothetical protein
MQETRSTSKQCKQFNVQCGNAKQFKLCNKFEAMQIKAKQALQRKGHRAKQRKQSKAIQRKTNFYVGSHCDNVLPIVNNGFVFRTMCGSR